MRRSRLIQYLFSLVLMVAFLEILTRLFYPTPFNGAGGEINALYGWALSPHTQYGMSNPDTGAPILYTTNERGWKDREHTLEKPEGVFRIVVVGDSNTWGAVKAGAEYTRQTERLLHEAGYPQVEVISIGIAGWGTDQELTALQNEGMLYEPDLVIDQFDVNDLWDILSPPADLSLDALYWAKVGRYHLDEGQLVYEPLPFRQTTPPRTIRSYSHLARALDETVLRLFYNYDEWAAQEWNTVPFPIASYQLGANHSAWELWAALVNQMHETAGAIPFFVYSLEGEPGKNAWYEHWYPEESQEVDFEAVNLQARIYLDTYGIPLLTPMRSYERYDNNFHATANGNLTMAEDLRDYLIEQGYLDKLAGK